MLLFDELGLVGKTKTISVKIIKSKLGISFIDFGKNPFDTTKLNRFMILSVQKL